jgi:outer membrane protein assembly factor BamB
MRFHVAFRTVLLACSIALALPYGAAQAGPVPPAWTRDFAAPIEWQRVTVFGLLLVSTRAGLHAVDPATGRVLWNHVDLAGLPEQGLEERAGSPLVLISDRAEVPRTVVLNVFNGQLVFDSRVAKVGQISSPRVLPRAGGLLVAGFEIGNPQPTLFAYSMNDGALLWKSDVLAAAANPSGNRLIGLLMTAALAVAYFKQATTSSAVISGYSRRMSSVDSPAAT